MSLIPAAQQTMAEAAAAALWEQFQRPITIVKKPIIIAINEGGSYMPGYGTTAAVGNFNYTPQSGTFNCLRVRKELGGEQDETTQKAVSTEAIIIKVREEARDYILNGETEHAIYLGKTYNIISQDQISHFLGRTYYYFKLELTN